MKTKSLSQLKDDQLGKIGTPKRDEYELSVTKMLEVEEYVNSRIIEELETIEDIINSENSGLSVEQRLLEVLKVIKELKQ